MLLFERRNFLVELTKPLFALLKPRLQLFLSVRQFLLFGNCPVQFELEIVES